MPGRDTEPGYNKPPELDVEHRADLAAKALDFVMGDGWAEAGDYRQLFAGQFRQIADAVPNEHLLTYPHLPFGMPDINGQDLTLEGAFTKICANAYPFCKYHEASDYQLWSQFTTDELNRMTPPGHPTDANGATVHGRAALLGYGGTTKSPKDRLLHFTDLSFDNQAPSYQEGDQTQVGQLEATRVEYEQEHPSLLLRSIGAGGVAMLMIQRLVEGKDSNERYLTMPLQWGWMNIPSLGRKEINNIQHGGLIRWQGRRPRLAHMRGIPNLRGGIGLSVGLRQSQDSECVAANETS